MFSDNGPRAWKTKMGSEHLDQDVTAIASAQAKGEARASIERVIETHKGPNDTKTEAV